MSKRYRWNHVHLAPGEIGYGSKSLVYIEMSIDDGEWFVLSRAAPTVKKAAGDALRALKYHRNHLKACA